VELRAVDHQRIGRVAVITLDRPHRGNAWTGRMHAEYRWCVQQAEVDPAVRVIVVTGRGSVFCVGGDSEALEGHADRGAYDDGLRGGEARPGYGVRPEFDHPFAFHFGLTKPVIAAVNGAAAGVGLVLACFADIRLARPGAKLTTAHGKLNLPAEYGLSWLLPRLVGLARATELLLSSRVLLTDEAHQIGLVHQLHPPDELVPATLAFAEHLASTVSAGSLATTRRQIYTDLHRDGGAAVQESLELMSPMMAHEDYRRGVAALRDRRPPEF
jgi:enoyl-CoA hydratase/carnithine racemase